MNLYIVEPLNFYEGAWDPDHGTIQGFVIRAETAQRARQLASRLARKEGSAVWLDANITRCDPLCGAGFEEVIMSDYQPE